MTRHRAIPATPDQIAQFGHIAAAIRAGMKEKGWTLGDLNEAMGLGRANTGIYAYANGKAAPVHKVRVNLGKALGLHEDDLLARPLPSVTLSERRAVAATDAPRPMVRGQGDVLNFSVDREGVARIKVDATMPLDRATPLLRMLLDAGLVFGEAHDG